MRKSKAITSCLPIIVKRDDREKEGHGWIFNKTQFCAGTEIHHLKTGDYTLEGFEKYLTIERKESVTEFVGNLSNKCFKNELIRMADIEKSFVLLEFEFADLINWPDSSGIHDRKILAQLPLLHPQSALTKFLELKLEYPYVDFQFVGNHGKILAGSIFKRVIERYARFIEK